MQTWRKLGLMVASAAALFVAAWVVAQRWVESGEPPADKIQRAMEQEAAKPRFSGRLGDFVVVPLNGELPAEANIFSCATTPVPVADSLRSEQLWSDAFADGWMGWACAGKGVVLVNNEGGARGAPGSDGSGLARGYIRSVPLPVARDAPRDRLELITVEGHPALLEHPIPDYPYGTANLVVIERFPEGEEPGIAVFIDMAPSVEAAIKHAEEIMP